MSDIIVLGIMVPVMIFLANQLRRNRKVFEARHKFLAELSDEAKAKKITEEGFSMAYSQMSYAEMMSLKYIFTPIDVVVKEWRERADSVKHIQKVGGKFDNNM
jgi:hypothetical protein